jgi:hypothetical protein
MPSLLVGREGCRGVHSSYAQHSALYPVIDLFQRALQFERDDAAEMLTTLPETPERTQQRSPKALALAQVLAHPFSLAFALTFAAWLYQHLREAQAARERAKARQLLAEVYNWFTEGFDTADLQEAKAVLEELSQQ